MNLRRLKGRMKTRVLVFAIAMIAACAGPAAAQTAAPAGLNDTQLQEEFRELGADRDDREKLRRGKDVLRRYYLSSQQVKTIALKFADESARYDFALAAFPRVVDPENFYEVYDAFKSFSKVLRLHDFVRAERGPVHTPPPAPAPGSTAVSDPEVAEMIKALKAESFDNARLKLAKQVLSSSRRPFLAAQIRRMAECFDFEPSRLDFAKYAWDYTVDREKYFLVNQAFSFQSSKDSLGAYIETRAKRQTTPEKE
jgi:hypothetical protein